jgi:hypothetical protein
MDGAASPPSFLLGLAALPATRRGGVLLLGCWLGGGLLMGSRPSPRVLCVRCWCGGVHATHGAGAGLRASVERRVCAGEVCCRVGGAHAGALHS